MSEYTRLKNLSNLEAYRRRRAEYRHRWLHDWVPARKPKPHPSELACVTVSVLLLLYTAGQVIRALV